MDYIKKREEILEGNLFKTILSLALPIMLTNFVQTLYDLTDSYYIGKLGGIQVAAISFVWPVTYLIISLGTGIGVATTSLVSISIGEKNYKKASIFSGQSISFSFILSIFLTIIGYYLAPEILSFMKAQGELLKESITYCRIILLSTPFLFFNQVFTSIKQGEGNTLSPLILSIISVFINIILNPIFIFNFGWGIAGAAWATVIARMFVTIYSSYLLFFKNKGIKIYKKHLIFHKNIIKKIIKIGLPSSIGQGFSSLGFIVLNVFIIKFGEDAMAAFGIGNRINSLLFLPCMGLGMGLTSIVGQNLGANNINRIKEAVKTSVIITIIFSVFSILLIYAFDQYIISFFTSDNSIKKMSLDYLSLISLSIPGLGLMQILISIYQGASHTKTAMFITMSRLWLFRLPMIIFFQHFTNIKEFGIWYSMVYSNYFVVALGAVFYFKGTWKMKK